jgi:hypothetical protein
MNLIDDAAVILDDLSLDAAQLCHHATDCCRLHPLRECSEASDIGKEDCCLLCMTAAQGRQSLRHEHIGNAAREVAGEVRRVLGHLESAACVIAEQ